VTEKTTVKNAKFETVKVEQLSNLERYGYPAVRFPRDAIVGALAARAKELGIPIHYDYKLVEILSDDATTGVTLRFSNDLEKSASLLIGADGIRSRIRKLAFPDAPDMKYTGQTGIMWSIPSSSLQYPGVKEGEKKDLGAIFMKTAQGVVLFVPDSINGTNIRVGIQRPLKDRDIEEWKALQGDKVAILGALRDVEGGIPEPVSSAIDMAKKDDSELFLWPFYTLSAMGNWVSKAGKGRIVVIGDAAHAFPPTGGQGAGMAIEDAGSLGIVLGEVEKCGGLEAALKAWQTSRKNRVDQVAAYVREIGKGRVAPGASIPGDGTAGKIEPAKPLGDVQDLAWLYGWKVEEDLTSWREKENDRS